MERFGWTSIFSPFYVEHRLLNDLISWQKSANLEGISDDLGRSFSKKSSNSWTHDEEHERNSTKSGRLAAHFGELRPLAVERGRESPLAIEHDLVRGDGSSVLWAVRWAYHRAFPATPDDVWADPTVRAVSREVFERDLPPSFLLLFTDDSWLLIARRWVAQRGALIVQWEDIEPGSDEESAMRSVFTPEAFVPVGGETPLLELLESYAFQHQEGLQRSLRSRIAHAIEAIATDVITAIERVPTVDARASDATRVPPLDTVHDEALQWVFCLLTLLYLEARADGGGLPWDVPAFRDGLSLRWLSSFTSSEPTTPEARDGVFLFESLATYMDAMHRAEVSASVRTGAGDQAAGSQVPLPSFGGGRFDPSRTPTLRRFPLANRTVLTVLRALMWVDVEDAFASSAIRDGLPASDHVGRGLVGGGGWMSYTGFSHEHAATMYQALLNDVLVQTREPTVELQDRRRRGPAYLVPASDLQRDGVSVPDEDQRRAIAPGRLVCRPLVAVRERHASFYTPDLLAKRLVSQTLDALHAERWRAISPAERVEAYADLRVCEPALGGAALLCEFLDQLTERYASDSAEATGEALSTQARAEARAMLAGRVLYGVEKHAPTRDFAEWCVRMHAFTPHAPVASFKGRFHTGDALVGARRAVWARDAVCSGAPSSCWGEPLEVGRGLPPAHTCWQFLVPVASMGDITHRRFRQRYAREVQTLDAWRSSMDAPWTEAEWDQLERLTSVIETLWRRVAGAKERWHGVNGSSVLSDDVRDDEERLIAVMNAWCALWRWPLAEVQHLPTRQQWLAWMTVVVTPVAGSSLWCESAAILGLDADAPQVLRGESDDGTSTGDWTAPGAAGARRVVPYLDLHFLYSVEPFWATVESVSRDAGFFHWGVGFADVVVLRGGFDVILSNPPWARVRWSAADALFEVDPWLAYRRLSLDEVHRNEAQWLARHPSLEARWLADYQHVQGLQNFLQDPTLFSYFERGQTNLHKYFITQAWRHVRADGVSSLMYETGVFSEAGASMFRQEAYGRLRRHATVVDGMGLFGLHGNARTSFHMSVFGGPSATVDFVFEPACTFDGTPDTSLRVDAAFLEAAGRFFGDDGPATQAMLPTTLSPASQRVLTQVGAWPDRWSMHDDAIVVSTMWHETRALASSLLVRDTCMPASTDEWFITGANIWVAHALAKTPKPICRSSHDYEAVDAMAMPSNFRPSSLYRIGDQAAFARRRPPVLPWRRQAAEGRHPADDYRLVVRRMATLTGERTLVAAIVPPGVQSIDTVFSVNVASTTDLLDLAACCASTLFDVMAKLSGRSNISDRWFLSLPRLRLSEESRLRIAALHALTEDYRTLWERAWHPSWASDTLWGATPTAQWQRDCGLRSDLARREALWAIDVDVAQTMGFGLDDIRAWMRDHAVRAQQVDASTWYDQRGMIVYHRSRRLADRGLLRPGDEVWVTPVGGQRYRVTTWDALESLEADTLVLRIDGRTGTHETFYPPFVRFTAPLL